MASAFLLSSGPAVLALLLIPSAPSGQTSGSNRQPYVEALTQPGRVWSCTSAVWDPIDVSIGDRGTQVFAGLYHNLFNDSHAMLLSRHDGDPAVPCWESPHGNEETFHADSAALADVHVMITYESTPVINQQIRRVEKFSSRGLDWVYTYPYLGAGKGVIGVSKDGGVIVASVGNPTTGLNDVLVFGPDSPVPVSTLAVPSGTLWGFDLAAEGTHAFFALGSLAYVLDLADGGLHLVYDNSPYPLSLKGLAISGNGSVVGGNFGGGIGLYERNGSDYARTWFRGFPGDAVVDISDDSSTMVYGMSFAPNWMRIAVECLHVPSKTVTMHDDVTNTGAYDNRVEDIAVTERGEVFAAATWGDEFGLVPELRIYSKHQNAPIQTLDLPGSAVTVDISPDGRWIAAGSRPMHAGLPGIGGRVDLFTLGRSDFSMATVPRIGNTVTFEVFGQPGRVAYLLSCPSVVEPGIYYPGWGTLHLDLATLSSTRMGVIGPSGSRTLDVNLPADPSLIGASRYFQGFTTDPARRLTLDWLVVTYLP